MSRLVYIFIFSIVCSASFAQKVELVHRSSFRHNYAVGRFVYIEEAADTSRLKYIATLRIHQDNYPYIVSNFVERFKTEAKDMGGNCFRLAAYEEKDSSVTLTIRTYFAPEKFFGENEKKQNKDKIYIFSSERRAGFEQYFYLNDSLRTFSSLHYFMLNPADKDLVKIAAYKAKTPFGKNPRGYNFKAGKESRFLVVGSHLPEANGFIKALAVVATVGLVSAVASTGGTGAPVYVPLTRSNESKGIASLPYTSGRILVDMYKEATH